ncbi:unnamed protein product [Phytophthora lilii]|uniref:Unnamed protein product n=1 Tax=Phytophthora lilii TaxID=2077276 RepID=A0A9W6TGA9_9STRA|nr:unnamed protein product [Phytophthora lilii]
MELLEDACEDELIDAFDAPEPNVCVSAKLPSASPQPKRLNLAQPTRPSAQEFQTKTSIPTLYPTFDDDATETPEPPVTAANMASKTPPPREHREEKAVQQLASPPAQLYREEELMSEQELQRKRQQIEHDMQVYKKRFDHVAQALAGETPHQIEERKKREQERLERREKRYEAMETRLQHQIERLEEREERRARIQARHHRSSRSPSLSSDCDEHTGEDELTQDANF